MYIHKPCDTMLHFSSAIHPIGTQLWISCFSFSIHALNPTPALNHAVFSPLEVKKALKKTLSSFNCWSSHRRHIKELQY